MNVNDLLDVGVLKALMVVKVFLRIVILALPFIVIFHSIRRMFAVAKNPDDMKKEAKEVGLSILLSISLFFIPTIVLYFVYVIDSDTSNQVSQYIVNATPEKIKELEEAIEAAEKEALAKAAADRAQARALRAEAAKEAVRRTVEEVAENQDVNIYEGNESGSYGKVEVKDGVFYIPNTRATKDSDIPKQSGTYGLNPIMAERLNKLLADAKANGYNVTVTSGWRSYSSQLSLWNNSTRSCATRGSWVACPGGSRHGFGIAADLSYNGTSCSQGNWNCNSAASWIHSNASRYGLTFRLSNEPWHIEPSSVSGGNFGACTQKC